MDIHKLLTSGAKPQEIEDQLLTLDSTFRFKCRRCGKCCKNQDTIIFNPRDIYNIAHKFEKTMEQVIRETSEVYIGHDSRLPIVHMVPRGPKNACPLLVDGKCSVHDCKPTVCALFPLGRVLWVDREAPPEKRFESMQIRYIINDIDCGSAKRVNTVRDWIAQFGIAEHDEFFLLWNQLISAPVKQCKIWKDTVALRKYSRRSGRHFLMHSISSTIPQSPSCLSSSQW